MLETKDAEITIIDLFYPVLTPEPYEGDITKHLAGQHDQKKHGAWAEGVGSYELIEEKVDKLWEASRAKRKELEDYLRSKGLPLNYTSWNSDPKAKKLRDEEVGLEQQARDIDQKFYKEFFGGSPNTPEFNELRDEYVVADTPTLSMNRNLRGSRPRMTQRIKNADEMCAQGEVLKDVGVYRGAILPKEMIDKVEIGSTYIDKGFQSTDLSLAMAKFYAETRQRSGTTGIPTILRMTLKTGLNAVDVGYGEIVVQRNSNIKVTGKSEDDGWTILDVEVSK